MDNRRHQDKRLRRQKGIEAANRHNRVEGLPPVDKFGQALQQRYINGEVTTEQAIAEAVGYYSKK